jgi:hypothetical protein
MQRSGSIAGRGVGTLEAHASGRGRRRTNEWQASKAEIPNRAGVHCESIRLTEWGPVENLSWVKISLARSTGLGRDDRREDKARSSEVADMVAGGRVGFQSS